MVLEALVVTSSLVVGGVLLVLTFREARAARIRAIFNAHPDWSRTPLEDKGGKACRHKRKWSAYGKTSEGVFWEVYLAGDEETPNELHYCALSLPLPQLELIITSRQGFQRFKALLPKIESMLNTFLGKMATKLASKFLAPFGLSLDDLLGFLKSAEEHPAGSPAFQAQYTLLTRGQLPLNQLITPAVEAILTGWTNRDFGLQWGTQGLRFHIKAGLRGSLQLTEQMVELGRLLTGGAASPQ